MTAQRRYSPEHLWFEAAEPAGPSDLPVRIGVTRRIQRLLTWIDRVDLPAVEDLVRTGEVLVAIDSQKTDLAVPTPVDLRITGVNDALVADPMRLRTDPPADRWLVTAVLAAGGWERLLDEDAYHALE